MTTSQREKRKKIKGDRRGQKHKRRKETAIVASSSPPSGVFSNPTPLFHLVHSPLQPSSLLNLVVPNNGFLWYQLPHFVLKKVRQ